MKHFNTHSRQLCFLALCLFLSFPVLGQTSLNSLSEDITISFAGNYDQRQDRNGHGMMATFRMRNDSIHFGDTVYHVRYPSTLDPEKIALAVNYFAGKPDNPLGKSIPYLLYPYDAPFPTIYQDTTYSFNFLAAERFDFRREDSTVVVTTHGECADCKFLVAYRKPNYPDAERKQMIETYFGNDRQMGKNDITDADHWLEDRRMNYRYAQFTYQDSTYAVGVYDYNCNGTYDDEGEDMVLLGSSREPLNEDRSKHGFHYEENALIAVQEHGFRLVDMEPSGASLTLRPAAIGDNSLGLRVGGYLSDVQGSLDVETATSIPSLISEEHPYTLFDVWGTWCKGCIVQLPQLKELVDQETGQLKIVGLNFGDEQEAIDAFKEKHAIPWTSWRVDNATIERLAISGFPSYLLLDQEGKLVFKTTSVVELKAFFD